MKNSWYTFRPDEWYTFQLTNTYELTENLHFSFKTTETNFKGVSKLVINDDVYDLKKNVSGSAEELSINDLQENKIYKVYFDGTRFIVDSLVLPAKKTEPGIISEDRIQELIRQSEI